MKGSKEVLTGNHKKYMRLKSVFETICFETKPLKLNETKRNENDNSKNWNSWFIDFKFISCITNYTTFFNLKVKQWKNLWKEMLNKTTFKLISSFGPMPESKESWLILLAVGWSWRLNRKCSLCTMGLD